MPIHRTAGELGRPFDLVPSTASAKAAEIRKRVRLSPLDAPWPLPELIEGNPALWTFSLNGFIANARTPPGNTAGSGKAGTDSLCAALERIGCAERRLRYA